MAIGKNVRRVDAFEKVSGSAKYTDDFRVPNCLVARVVRSTIANGLVKSINTEEALKVDGVVKIITCFDVPDIQFPTAGHPWSVEKAHQDVADRKLLNRRVRVYGDDIAVVIAEDDIAAKKAVRLVEVEYEEYPVVLTCDEAMAEGATPLHDDIRKDNVLVHTSFTTNNDCTFDEVSKMDGLVNVQGKYSTPTVQHCHIENVIHYAYMEDDRIVIVSSTQIPHIARRVAGQALGIPWGKIRVIKPYIGGGFGNKQEVLYEPLVAYLTTQVGGRPVKIELDREETFACSRVRHAIDFEMDTYVRPEDGRLIGRKYCGKSNQGGYASHGHAIGANAANEYRMMYQDEKVLESETYTVYTNKTSAGAMRGYGIPQICFSMECHMDDVARAIDMDPIKFRKANMMKLGYMDASGIYCHSTGLEECIEKGKEIIKWDELREKYKNQTGPIRRGVGMAIFSYKTGVHPISLETASSRVILNQDGSVNLQMGATEIGQGADTAFSQMCAETIGITFDKVNIVSFQDTDVTPFDTGAYASRQSYVSGGAVKKASVKFKQRVLDYASYMLKISADNLDIEDNKIVHKTTRQFYLDMETLAMEAFYSLDRSEHITAEATNHCKNNTYSFGCTFAEVEVDMAIGKVETLNIVNVHDAGTLINPQLAEAQVHGGMHMGMGYALSEELKYNKDGKPLNNNLLDYKMDTAMDTPDFKVDFVETHDPSAPYGNKSLGEPPTLTQAPAIRNAVLHATGVAFNSNPLTPQKLVERFLEENLI